MRELSSARLYKRQSYGGVAFPSSISNAYALNCILECVLNLVLENLNLQVNSVSLLFIYLFPSCK